MSFQIYDFKTEYMENPLGLDCEKPRFSWKMKADEKDARQTGYQITVGTREGAASFWAAVKQISMLPMEFIMKAVL